MFIWVEIDFVFLIHLYTWNNMVKLKVKIEAIVYIHVLMLLIIGNLDK